MRSQGFCIITSINLMIESKNGKPPMEPADRELTKTINQFNILNTIRKAGLISRVEIAELTGQSRAAVTNITARLIKEKMIFEKETKTSPTRGRRRIMLALNPQAAHVVGVKLSAFQVSFAVTNLQADVLSSLIVPVRTGKRTVEFMADLIEEGIRHCVAEARLSMRKISGIGIGIPGLIDSEKGIVYWSPLYMMRIQSHWPSNGLAKAETLTILWW
jgi:DNA-binding MarR family transcriptional regulator